MLLYEVRQDVLAPPPMSSVLSSEILGGRPSDRCERCFQSLKIQIPATTRNPSQVEIGRKAAGNTGTNTIATLLDPALSASFQLPPLPHMSSLCLPSFSSWSSAVNSSPDGTFPLSLHYVSVPVQSNTTDTVGRPTNYNTISSLLFEDPSSNRSCAQWTLNTRQKALPPLPSADCTGFRTPGCPVERLEQAGIKFWKFSAGLKNLRLSALKAAVNPRTLLKKCRCTQSSKLGPSRSIDAPPTALFDSLGTVTSAELKDQEDLRSWIGLSNADFGIAVSQLSEAGESFKKAEAESVMGRSGNVHAHSEERGASPGRLSVLFQSRFESQDCNFSGFPRSLDLGVSDSPSIRIFTVGRDFVCADTDEVRHEETMPGGWWFGH